MKLLQVAEQNKPYYSEDYVIGFNDGAKAQHKADKKDSERHGRWEHIVRDLILEDGTKIGTVVQTECSVCHREPLYNKWHNQVESPVCPNCGADMRGERDG